MTNIAGKIFIKLAVYIIFALLVIMFSPYMFALWLIQKK